MKLIEITRRTKNAIRIWAQDPDAEVVLDDPLSKFQHNDLQGLRVRVNQQFTGERGFPISSNEWGDLELETVRNVRDAAKERLEGDNA